MMKNELQIKPLLEYRLTFLDDREDEVFTAESHDSYNGILTFYRTGNIVRQYFYLPCKMVITPVNPDAQIPE